MKRSALLLLTVAVTVALGCGREKTVPARDQPSAAADVGSGRSAPEPGRTYRVGFSQIVDHPALDATREGFLEGLRQAGFVDGDNLIFEYQSAQGDVGNARLIAQKFLADRVDLLAPCTTPNAQAAVRLGRGGPVPIVFGCITDPVGAGVLETVDRPTGSNITGMYHPVPVAGLFDLFLEIMPGLERAGTIFNASETNATVMNNLSRQEAARRGLEWREATVASSADVRAAAESLAGRIQAFVITQDNTVASAFEAVVLVARARRLPIFAMDALSVERGAVAALAIDQFDSGVQWATELAVPVLLGQAPGGLMPIKPRRYELFVNPDAAARVALTIPRQVLDRADHRVGAP